MIRELFFPRTIKNKLLFAENIVGISIDGLTISMAHIHCSRNSQKIIALEQFAINSGDPKTYNQRLGAALKKIPSSLPKRPTIRVNYPSSKVVLKQITVPFLETEKIRMVVEYEIESSIPFSLEHALIDFIILEQSEVKESSVILVAAAQLEEVKKYTDLFIKAGMEPHAITIDMFGCADLFNRIPAYEKMNGDSALIDIGSTSTRITLLSKKNLVTARTINLGNTANDDDYTKLFEEISFTLNSFDVKREEPLSIKHLFYIGNTELFDHFAAYSKESLHLECHQFATEKIADAPGVKVKATAKPSWLAYTRALGIALPSSRTNEFTLRRKEIAYPIKPMMSRQIFTAVGLLILLFGALGTKGYLDVRELNQRIERHKKQEVQRMRKLLPAGHPGKKKAGIKQLIRATEEYVQEQEEIWAPFSQQRLRPTETLQELCMIFNRKKYDLTIDEVLISGEENEAHPIEVRGLFRSKTGADHFKYFSDLEADIKASPLFVLTEEVDPTPTENGNGIEFTVRFKQKEE